MTKKRQPSDGAIARAEAEGLRIIIAELCESSAKVAVEWALGSSAEEQGDEDKAMTHLANVTIQLGIIEVQLADIRMAAESALDQLEEATEATPESQ